MKTYYRVNCARTDGTQCSAPFDAKPNAVLYARGLLANMVVLTDTVEIVKYVTSRVPFRTLKMRKSCKTTPKF